MNAEQQPWQIHLQAKAKNFNFKLKATRYLPACYSFFQFSIFLKIYSLIIRVNHQPTRPKSLKSKITGFIRSLPTTFSANNSARIKKLNCEGPICGSSVVIGNLAQSIFDKDVKGIIVNCFSMLLYILTLLKTFIRTKNNKLMSVLILSMVGWLYMKNNPTHGRRTFAWRYFFNTWNWAIAQDTTISAIYVLILSMFMDLMCAGSHAHHAQALTIK